MKSYKAGAGWGEVGHGCSALTELAPHDGIWCKDRTVVGEEMVLRERTDCLFSLEERRWSVWTRR